MDIPIRISFSGWAVKLGARVKNWKRRWFVLLSNGTLRYFEDKNAFQEKGHIKLDHSTSVSIAPATSEGIPIQIINAKRTFIMTFPTREEAEQWSKKINEAVAHSSS